MRFMVRRSVAWSWRPLGWVLVVIWGLGLCSLGCSGESGEPTQADFSGDGIPGLPLGDTSESSGDSPFPGTDGDVPVPEAPSCEGQDCLGCFDGADCGPEGEPRIDDTCCSEGDSLVHLDQRSAPEAVDVVSDGDWAVLCGGFGATIVDVSDPANLFQHGKASARCQHAALLPPSVNSLPTVVVSHHGDTWVQENYLASYALLPEGGSALLATVSEPGVLYEGIVERDGIVYAAVHDQGLRVYDFTDPQAPVFVSEVPELANAWRLALAGDVLYVADFEGGLAVISLADPWQPSWLETVVTPGPPRDVAVHDNRLFVAMGGFGVAAYDTSAPEEPLLVGVISTLGTAQRVAVNDSIVAVAAWNHVATYDADSLELVATERLAQYPLFEQDLAVALVGGLVLVAEWNDLHTLQHRTGYVAPDLWIEESIYQFAPGEAATRTVVVENRGSLPLEVMDVQTTNAAFDVSKTAFAIEPGEKDFFEISYTPTGGAPEGQLLLTTNDPDPFDSAYRTGLIVEDSTKLNVGDSLTDAFGFLDPTGGGELSALEGHVVILAYFALF